MATSAIGGEVFAIDTATPLSGVTITAKNTSTNASESSMTDSGGTYLFPALAAGTYLITAICSGYQSADTPLSLTGGAQGNTVLNFFMSSNANPLVSSVAKVSQSGIIE